MPAVSRHIQIYTGNGKGKTTAAIGQVIRAAGHGLSSFWVTFMKDHLYGEFIALKKFGSLITIEQYGNDEFVFRKEPPGDDDLAAARLALNRGREAMLGGDYDIVVLDEICVCTYFDLLTADDVIPVLDEKPEAVELILTGRYCPESWLERADLVTEMKEIKHYYRNGILARDGFEN